MAKKNKTVEKKKEIMNKIREIQKQSKKLWEIDEANTDPNELFGDNPNFMLDLTLEQRGIPAEMCNNNEIYEKFKVIFGFH